MNDFYFEENPWETSLNRLRSGSTLSAAKLLAILEDAGEESIDGIFQILANKKIEISLNGFPKTVLTGQDAVRLHLEEEIVKTGLSSRQLEENDPLRLYLEELASLPSFGDETMLAAELAAGKNSRADELMNLGLSRVVEIAQQYVGYGVLLLDLIQEGSMGLWQAIQDYDGGEYIPLRDRAIQNAMAKAVILQAQANGIGQKMRQSMQDYRSVDEKLLSEYGRNPSLEEIAAELHITPEEADRIRKMLEDAYLLQQAEKAVAPEEDNPEEELAVEETSYFQMRQRIQDLLSQLNETDARILTLRFGLEKGLPMTPEETSRTLGMTVNEITSREVSALAKLRKFS